MVGYVLFFNKTYGFIRTEQSEEDVFFHWKDIIGMEYKELHPGDKVEFDLHEDVDKKKIKATNVKYITEYMNGKKLLTVHIFCVSDGQFLLKDFYNRVISKIPIGLKFVNLLGDKMVVTSEEIDLDNLIRISSFSAEPDNKKIYTDILPDYAIKYI